ncbi:MAG: Vitamin B12 import ATP-binding protein BtuD [Phycisphaerae bacterium]|nr:Vitamin B12 import ATP-binding protein BtuD [Phycisphaerae bacterium]
MDQTNHGRGWLPQFRRCFTLLRTHRRPLTTGLLLAIGVSLFYTASISSVVPLLKIMFAEHEPLATWVHRLETERRLGVRVPADIPDSLDGLRIDGLHDDSPLRGQLLAGEHIRSVGTRTGSYELMRLIATTPDATLPSAVVVNAGGTQRSLDLACRPRNPWRGALVALVGLLPPGADHASRARTLGIVMIALVIMAVLGGVCRFFNEGLVATAVQRAMHDLRTALASHVLRLPVDWHARHPPGDALSRFAQDIGKIEVGLTTLFGKMAREPLKAAGVLILTLLIDWKLLIVALIGMPIGGIVLRTFGRRIKHAQRRASQSWGLLLDHLGERLAGIRVVKAYGMEQRETHSFGTEDQRLTRAQTHVELIDAATNPVLEVLAMTAIAAFVYIGGVLVFQGQLEANLFFAAVICLAGMFDPVRKLGNVNNRLQAAEASAGRIFELIDLPVEHLNGAAPGPAAAQPTPRELPPLRHTIRFEHLGFAYPAKPRTKVIDDFDLTVQRGEMVALVGPNGSGKTTLISLLLRFFQPQRGRILIDDVDIASVTLDSLRRQIGLVTQDAVIFSESVRFNIAYGAPDVTEAALLRAAQMAHADEFVRELRGDNGSSRAGYDALVSSRTLSGGQRQRLAIARAILRDPPILVFDEATSQVDAHSERKIQEALDEVTVGRTTFVIAHRFSTIARADKIVVLDAGRIVGVGRHEELLTRCPLYATLCRTQFVQTA